MYNWSTDITKFKTQEEYDIWRLESLINFGLNGEKINYDQLIKYWSKLNLDPLKKKYLQFLIDEKRSKSSNY